ncbi:MAG: 5-formyltetrahydrofolate cyclo-ligase [Alistipes sp.]|jgi:5-formyltetrahydrofolate cyclo-ligase|nr:5-formyltetrahydrofolate cyclo-ligase [Alistipes sp.]
MQEQMQDKKKALRATLRAAGTRVTENAKTERCNNCNTTVTHHLELSPHFATARTIALYHALPDEAPTSAMLERWRAVKRLALPVVTGDGTMEFREYTGEKSVTNGTFGIGEPRTGAVIPAEEIDLMIVPGVAFDTSGHRLGHGRGFYDRFLSHPSAAHIRKVGLCCPHALVAEVPHEPHDIKMDEVVVLDF